MSAPVFPDDVKFAQQMLCSAGCYNGPRDGVWNNDVDHADLAFESLSDTVAKTFGTFDPRSEKCIRTLHPKAQEAARRFLIAARAAGIDAQIISGTRTFPDPPHYQLVVGKPLGDIRLAFESGQPFLAV